MYEMYPDAWHVTDERHHDAEKPRRRVRKDHSVAPVVHVSQVGRESRLGA